MAKQSLTNQIWKIAILANPKAKRLKLHTDNDGYFLVLFIFVSTEDIIVNEDAENMFGIFSNRGQKWLKFFHHLTLGTVHKSYLIEAKHLLCQYF